MQDCINSQHSRFGKPCTIEQIPLSSDSTISEQRPEQLEARITVLERESSEQSYRWLERMFNRVYTVLEKHGIKPKNEEQAGKAVFPAWYSSPNGNSSG